MKVSRVSQHDVFHVAFMSTWQAGGGSIPFHPRGTWRTMIRLSVDGGVRGDLFVLHYW